MSERRTESFNASDEQRWQAQERTLRALRDRIAPAPNDEQIHVDDAAIFDALSQPPVPTLPADFVAAVTAASESLRERQREVRRFRRMVFGGLALTYAAAAGTGLPMFDDAGLKIAVLAVSHGLHDAPWLVAALAIAALVATLGGRVGQHHAASP